MANISISLLVEDLDLYPRTGVDPYHVNSMVETLKVGKTLPPVKVGQVEGAKSESWTIVDGIHRVRAYRKVNGVEAKIPAITELYPTKEEMILDAVRLNASHGRALTPQDKTRSIVLLEKAGFQSEVIASALNLTMEKFNEMKLTRTATYKDELIPLKQTTMHFAGKELTNRQIEYQEKAGGLHQTFYINQVISMLEYDAVDWESEQVVRALHKLFELLEVALKVEV